MKEYTYHINLDERGDFNADVRDENGKTVYQIDGFDIFEDGFMRNKRDLAGLTDYLHDLGVLPDDAAIVE